MGNTFDVESQFIYDKIEIVNNNEYITSWNDSTRLRLPNIIYITGKIIDINEGLLSDFDDYFDYFMYNNGHGFDYVYEDFDYDEDFYEEVYFTPIEKTKIITLETLNEGYKVTIIIPNFEWFKFKCPKICCKGNTVTFLLDECVRYVTGYFYAYESFGLEPHTNTINAFKGVYQTTIQTLFKMFYSKGYSFDESKTRVLDILSQRISSTTFL